MEEASTLNWSSMGAPILQMVRQSCASLMHPSNPHVQIDDGAVASLAHSLDHSRLHRQPKRMYPLHFPTPRSEINFLCTLAMLQVGSGWRRALHAQRGGKGAADTVTFGVMGMHISGEITADAMLRVGLFDVAQLFGLKIQEEYELSPGIHSERPTALYSLAQTLRKILNDTGSMLRNLACEDWADFWLHKHARTARVEVVDEADAAEAPRPKAEDAVKRLVRYFSALQDAYVLPASKEPAETETVAAAPQGTTAAVAPAAAAESKEAVAPAPASASSSSSSGVAATAAAQQRVVYILKKAQLMVADLERRFGVRHLHHQCVAERHRAAGAGPWLGLNGGWMDGTDWCPSSPLLMRLTCFIVCDVADRSLCVARTTPPFRSTSATWIL